MGSSLNPWLQREWTSAASHNGVKLLVQPGNGTPRAQWTRTLGETLEENGEKLIWAKLSDSMLEIDVCFSRECVKEFNDENAVTLTACGGDKDLFKLLEWKFCLASPPSKTSSTSSTKVVCLRVDKVQHYGSGNRNVVVARGKQLVEFRKHEKVREQLGSIENPKGFRQEHPEENVTYQDDLPSSAPKQPKPPPPAIPPKEQLTFKLAPSRKKSTTTSLPTSLSSYDWSLVWPPPNESYSSFNVPSSKISETCERRRKDWIESWVRNGKKSGKRVSPELVEREEARGRNEKEREKKRKREMEKSDTQPPSSDAIASTSTSMKNEKSISRRPTPINPLPIKSNTKVKEPPKTKPSQITRSSSSPSQHLSQSNSSSNASQGKGGVKKKQGEPKKVDRKGKGKAKEVVIEGEEEQNAEEMDMDEPPSFSSSLLLKNDETPSSGTLRLCQQQQQMDEEKSVRTPFAVPPDDSSVVESDVEVEVEAVSDGDTIMGEKKGVSRMEEEEEEDSADESEEDVANSLLSQRQDKKNVSSPFALTGQQQQFDSEEEEENADTEDEHQRSSYKTANESKLSLQASRPRPSAPPTTTARSLLLKPRLLPRPRLSLPSQSSQQPFTQNLPSPSFAPPLAAQTKPLTPPTASLFNQTQGDSTMDSSIDLSGQERDMPRGNQEGMREQAEKRKREIRERKEAEEMERRKAIVEEWNEAERRRKEDEETKAREDREREELEAVQQGEKEEYEEKERRSREADRKKEKEIQSKRKEEEKENVLQKLSRQTSTTSSSSSSKRKRVDTTQVQDDVHLSAPSDKDPAIVEEQISTTTKRPRPATPLSLSPSNTRQDKRPRLSPPPFPATNPYQAAFKKLVEARRTSRPRSPVGETSREKLKRLEKSIKRLSKLGGQDI